MVNAKIMTWNMRGLDSPGKLYSVRRLVMKF